MKRANEIILAAVVFASAGTSLQAQESLRTLSGRCSISASSNANEFDLRLEQGECGDSAKCGTEQMQEPADAFTGFALADLRRDGAQMNAVMRAEAGTLTCAGAVRNAKLEGEFTFVPNASFVAEMRKMGFSDLDSGKLQAYTLFHIDTPWIESLQNAGVGGLDSGNLIALKIFHVDSAYVHSLGALGYATPDADKLIALRVQHVEPAEVKQIRAMGYQPTLDELIQMRIFHVTPDFIRRMKTKGLTDLTISKLVQIRIFNLAE